MKKNVAVLFGSRSVEHDVSIVTGIQLIENIDREKYNVIPVYIAKDGEWYTGQKLCDISFVREFDKNAKEIKRVYLPPAPGNRGLLTHPASGGLFGRGKQECIPVDVFIPALHGLHGEDGTIQGLLELADIPYTSAGVVGSAAGMDKYVMKCAFKGAGVPVVEGVVFNRDEWEHDPDAVANWLEEEVGYPMFIKPANLGSSIGINRADDREKLLFAVTVAAPYDRRIIAEQAIVENIEINCSCMGFGGDVTPSVCEQPISWGELLDFSAKYLSGGKTGSASTGMASLNRMIPAPISDELTNKVQDLSVKIFKTLDCKGVVRIDFLYDTKNDKLYANEINTIPGSFAFYLWEPLGIPYSELIDRLIAYAEVAHREKARSSYAFESDILKKTGLGAKGAKGSKFGKANG
ncbi:MAG: D-alanine--D-alanine ligase family protein [Christensenellales bacterium]|jgi:D-alanine-D-alanine ligase